MMPDKFYSDQPPLPRQRNLGQSAISRLVYEISRRSLCITGSLRGRAIEWCQTNYITTSPRCHGNEIWDKIGYNSACIRDIYEKPAACV